MTGKEAEDEQFDDESDEQLEHVAIIGMAGRFPGARNLEQFWQNIRDGVESISFFDEQELAAHGTNPATLDKPTSVGAGGLLEDVDLFDAPFFGFSTDEAEITDPQQRLFLECAWEALEAAGYNPDGYDKRIGLYAGATISTYLLNELWPRPDVMQAVGRARSIIGNDPNFLTTMVSYKLNLNGPSVTVQTACSTSLVAVHLACQSLLNGESDITLAGGVSISIPQVSCYEYREGGIHSPDGHCRAFDAQAEGTVGGSGLGIVVLKRLDDALADGDTIHAVIKGSAINNDGSLKVGYTAPSVHGQAAVISEALAMAGVNAETISYVEAHGTGTPLGDPIEITALTQAYRATTTAKNYCAVGSVKTNVGHLDTAAGVAGLIKTALALKHGELPPSLHYVEANPKIDFAGSPFYVNTRLTQWETKDGAPRRAGVSALGIGGTNAHVIVEEAPAAEFSEPSGASPQLLLLSAKTRAALDTATANLIEFIKRNPNTDPAGVAYTLQVGRKAFTHRRAVVCRTLDDVLSAFEEQDAQRVLTSFHEGGEPPVVLLFTAKDSSYASLGRNLYRHEPLFREQVERCAKLLGGFAAQELRETVNAKNESFAARSAGGGGAQLSPPALFAVQYSLGQLWLSYGVRPAAFAGGGVGEYAAACLAGVMTAEEALRAVAAREQTLRELPAGEFDEATVKPFTALLAGFKLNAPKPALASSLTGKWVTPEEAVDPLYWTRSLRRSTSSRDTLVELLREPERTLFDVGTGQVWSSGARWPATDGTPLETTGGPEAASDMGREYILHALARLWLAGVAPNWNNLHLEGRRHRISLPTYPFERRRYWVGSANK